MDKNFSYVSGYYPIPSDTKLPYKYPKSAYGVMAFWDIGHRITYISHRIPNTNNFQQGIVEYNNTAGAAPFFTSLNEEQAVKNLNLVGSRYVIVDSKMSANIGSYLGVWCNDTKGWDNLMATKLTLVREKSALKVPVDSKKFSQSMTSRLYYEDTNGPKHFRLVHESDGNYLVSYRRVLLKPIFHLGMDELYFKHYQDAKKEVARINTIVWMDQRNTVLAYAACPPVKNIKIFEKVAGAVIRGQLPKNIKNHAKVTIALKLKTKFDREFTYQQTARVDNRGKYQFIVPYPTAAMRGENYCYDIISIPNYYGFSKDRPSIG